MCASEVLLIALGNPLRRDDGVAQKVVDLLPRVVCSRRLLQLTPEVAPTLAGFDLVVFIDADVQSKELKIEAVGQNGSRSALSHHADPASIVELATRLFGFTGRALLCRVPGEDFSSGEGLSPQAAKAAAAAAVELEKLLSVA